MKIKNLFLCCCISTFGLAMNAQADIVTFESLAHTDNLIVDHGATYTEGGFLFTNIATVEDSGLAPSLATYGSMVTLDQEPFGYYTGSTALINNNYEGVTVLTRLDGNAFSLNSIDLAELYAYDDATYAFDVTFNGLLANGSSVSQTVTLDNLTGVQTYVFGPAFSNVVAVNWAQGGADFHQFDNVNAAPVPVPAAVWLLGSGFAGLVGLRRRARK
jgi:hypothetical protein